MRWRGNPRSFSALGFSTPAWPDRLRHVDGETVTARVPEAIQTSRYVLYTRDVRCAGDGDRERDGDLLLRRLGEGDGVFDLRAGGLLRGVRRVEVAPITRD